MVLSLLLVGCLFHGLILVLLFPRSIYSYGSESNVLENVTRQAIDRKDLPILIRDVNRLSLHWSWLSRRNSMLRMSIFNWLSVFSPFESSHNPVRAVDLAL